MVKRTNQGRRNSQGLQASAACALASPSTPEESRQHEESLLAVIETPLLQPEAGLAEASVISTARSRAPSPEERPTATGGDPESEKDRVCVVVSPLPAYGLEQVEQQNEDVPDQVEPNGTIQHTGWLWDHHNQVHWLGPATVDGQVVEINPDSEQGVVGNPHGGHIRQGECAALDAEVNEQFDMDAELSVPMVEDQFESPQFGSLSSTTFNPPLAHSLPPYIEYLEDQQDDIVLDENVPECAEDSAMEDAAPGPQQAAGILAATQMIQPLPWIPFAMPNSEYLSAAGALPQSCVETLASGATPVPNLDPVMLGNLYAPDPVVLHDSIFPQAAPVQENSSLFGLDGAQSSVLEAEMEPLEQPRPVVSTVSSTSFAGAPANCSTGCSPSLLSPPRAVSTLASPATPGDLIQRNGDTEVPVREINSGLVPRIGIQRKMLPLRCVDFSEYVCGCVLKVR